MTLEYTFNKKKTTNVIFFCSENSSHLHIVYRSCLQAVKHLEDLSR